MARTGRERRSLEGHRPRQEGLPLLLAHGDGSVRLPYGDDEAFGRAHHHALDHRLAADVRLSQAFALVSYFLRNRSTRPAVSISLYLPVKYGWQFEQISTLNEPRVERVSITFPQAQTTRAGG